MPRCASLSAALLAPLLVVSGCLSAETSEASQLTRLEHGIDDSTTVPDRFNSRGEVPPEAKAASVTPAVLAAPPVPAPITPRDTTRDQESAVRNDPPEDSTPRPTLRIWGAPSGHAATPGFVPVAKIVYDEPAPSATTAK
jgi:hypothetical protein